jgi:hypothetical protein
MKNVLDDLIKDPRQLEAMYLGGSSVNQIAKIYGKSTATVERFFRRHKFQHKPREGLYRKHAVDLSFFEKIDSHDKAQILGFIAADGCVTDSKERGVNHCNTLHINIQEQDKDYLEIIKEKMKQTKPLETNRLCQAILRINSNKMVRDLNALGISSRKSLTLAFPNENQVPKEFLFSFVRGYFEGDGSIYSYTQRGRKLTCVTFIGSDMFIGSLGDHLRDEGIRFGISKKGKVSYMAISHKKDGIPLLLDKMYANASFVMKRKFDRYQQYAKEMDSKIDNLRL